MYDYGARFYMPDVGRWGVVDPLAEKAPNLSPFRYGFNNPVRYTDPKGLFETKFGAWWHRMWNGGDSSGSIKYNDNKKEYYYNRGNKAEGNEVNFTPVYNKKDKDAGSFVVDVGGKVSLGVQAGAKVLAGSAEAGIMTTDVGSAGWSNREKKNNGFYAKGGDGKGHNFVGGGIGIKNVGVSGKLDYVTNDVIPKEGSDLLEYYPNNGVLNKEGNIGVAFEGTSRSPFIPGGPDLKGGGNSDVDEACNYCLNLSIGVKLLLGVEANIKIGFTGGN